MKIRREEVECGAPGATVCCDLEAEHVDGVLCGLRLERHDDGTPVDLGEFLKAWAHPTSYAHLRDVLLAMAASRE